MNFIRSVQKHVAKRTKFHLTKEDVLKEAIWNMVDMLPGEKRGKFMEELTADIKAELQIFGDRTIGR